MPKLTTAFLDTGGTVDNACLTVCESYPETRIIIVVAAIFWRISDKDGVAFGTIRADINKLNDIHKFDLIGCETNNYGRTEIESMEREYGIRMAGINTVGKLTDKKKIDKGNSMDKEAIIKFTNTWRQNAVLDPKNEAKLGQILFTRNKTPELQKIINELDSFVRKIPSGIGTTGRPRYGAEGNLHDDGVMSMLGNFFLIKTRIMIMGDRMAANIGYGNQEYREYTPPKGREIFNVKPKADPFPTEKY